MVVIPRPGDEPSFTAGWQKAFVPTRENASDFARFVATGGPELMLLDPVAGDCLVRPVECQGQHANQLPEPSAAAATELATGPSRTGRWSPSPEQRQVFGPDGRSRGLTTAEYDALLLRRRGHQPASRTEISLSVLGRPHRAGDRAVDILVHKRRAKPGADALVTILGAGYAFAALPDAAPIRASALNEVTP